MFQGCYIPPNIAVQDGDGSREAEGADHYDPEERVLEEGDRLEQREKDVGDNILQPADASVEQFQMDPVVLKKATIYLDFWYKVKTQGLLVKVLSLKVMMTCQQG
jgi:hypothetical protein